MVALNRHLSQPGDQERLTFGPGCPVCAVRLAGGLARRPIVGRRTQALLTAGVLALATVSPTAVLAGEPDQQQEGAAAPEQVAIVDPPSEPAFDPGGESTEVPFDTAAEPEVQAPADPLDNSGAIEPEPPSDENVPAADLGDGSETSVGDAQQPPSATTPASPAPMPHSDPSLLAPDPAAPKSPPISPSPVENAAPGIEEIGLVPVVETPTNSEADGVSPADQREPETAPTRPEGNDGVEPLSIQAAPAPQPVAAPAESVVASPAEITPKATHTRSSAAASRTRAARRGNRSHVVQRGESLWSIAQDLLGDTAANARVAREVNRLWELNSSRIGTGNPDLLAVGTRLVLPS